jgi:hypothetical protein
MTIRGSRRRQAEARVQQELATLASDLTTEAARTQALQRRVDGLVAEVSRAKRSRTWVWIGGATSIVGVVVAFGTLFYSMAQLVPLNAQAESAQAQTQALQRTSDWAIVGAVSVSIEGMDFILENRSPSAIMSTTTWLVGDTEGWKRFDAIRFDLEGIPGCSRVSVPIAEVTRWPEPIRELTWVEPRSTWEWPEFVDAYTYVIAPSGGLYSTSSRGGVVEHGVVGMIDQASANYGERETPIPVDFKDPSTLVWIPDTFWEFSEVQVAHAGAPLWAGAPLMGAENGSVITPLSCDY